MLVSLNMKLISNIKIVDLNLSRYIGLNQKQNSLDHDCGVWGHNHDNLHEKEMRCYFFNCHNHSPIISSYWETDLITIFNMNFSVDCQGQRLIIFKKTKCMHADTKYEWPLIKGSCQNWCNHKLKQLFIVLLLPTPETSYQCLAFQDYHHSWDKKYKFMCWILFYMTWQRTGLFIFIGFVHIFCLSNHEIIQLTFITI